MDENPEKSITKSTRRKKGGQRGNLNALKHGFYAREFSEQEAIDLDEVKIGGIEDEIKILKVAARRLHPCLFSHQN